MAQILVRDIDEKVVEKLKRRARKDGRSLQSEVKIILEKAADAPVVDMKKARALIMSIRRELKGRDLSDGVNLIREDRDR
jgi:antitoxin FitA